MWRWISTNATLAGCGAWLCELVGPELELFTQALISSLLIDMHHFCLRRNRAQLWLDLVGDAGGHNDVIRSSLYRFPSH